MKTFKEINEEIKGWKNASSDINKFRTAQNNNAKTVKLHKLKKDGSESGMHDAITHHDSEDAARAKMKYWTELNPKSNLKWNMYVDGKIL